MLATRPRTGLQQSGAATAGLCPSRPALPPRSSIQRSVGWSTRSSASQAVHAAAEAGSGAPAAEAAAPPAAAAGEPRWFSVEMDVRDYELDQYSVVNNAVYANYLQHVRHLYLLHVGLQPDTIARTGDALALSELNMRYVRPLRSGDRFRLACRVSKCTGVRAVFEQAIWLLPRAGEDGGSSGSGSSNSSEEPLVLTGEAVVVSLDRNYKPKRIGKELQQRLLSGEAAAGPPVPMQEFL